MKSGIYKIFWSEFPDKFYIGSSVNLKKRKSTHFRELAAGSHHNSKLQNFYNKYGPAGLTFQVLVYCPDWFLLKTEQSFINDLKPFFNINPLAGSRLGSNHLPVTKQKIRYVIKHKARLKPRNFFTNRFVKHGL